MRFSLSSNNFRTLVCAADVGAACAGGLDGVDDVLALESRLAHVHDGVELTKTVVVACEVETLGVVSLDSRVVAVKVLELELGIHDGLCGLLVLGDGSDDGLGDVDHHASLEQKAFKFNGGLELGIEAVGGLNSLLEDGSWNLCLN